jgi:hypothetical protein
MSSKKKIENNKINLMNLKYLSLFLIILISVELYGQRALSKSEIISFWKVGKKRDRNELESINELVSIDSSLQFKVQPLIKQIRTTTDTLGFFLIADYALTTIDSCKNGAPPSDIYIYWQKSGKTYLQKATNHCVSSAKEVTNSSIFSFYKKNESEINREEIMPVILGARIEDKKIVYNKITSNHDIIFSIYCKIGPSTKLSQFSKDDITNQQGLFYEDNLTSKLYKWFLLIRGDISKY